MPIPMQLWFWLFNFCNFKNIKKLKKPGPDGDPGRQALANARTLPEDAQETGLVAIDESWYHVP